MQNYSYCRMVARDSWVKENPTTVKLLNEALIRAQCYFEGYREDCVELMAEQLESVGGLEEIDDSVNIEDRIYNDLYKEALDAATEKYGDEDPGDD